jgi:hypothetical protein
MYELWTIKPANMVMTFDTAREAESIIQYTVLEKGLAALKNHAIFVGDEAEDDAEFIAENEEILAAITRIRLLDDTMEAIDSAFGGLNTEATELIAELQISIPEFEKLKMSVGQSQEWIKGFLAAALHNVQIDIAKGELEIGKPLEKPVFKSKSLTPTG